MKHLKKLFISYFICGTSAVRTWQQAPVFGHLGGTAEVQWVPLKLALG